MPLNHRQICGLCSLQAGYHRRPIFVKQADNPLSHYINRPNLNTVSVNCSLQLYAPDWSSCLNCLLLLPGNQLDLSSTHTVMHCTLPQSEGLLHPLHQQPLQLALLLSYCTSCMLASESKLAIGRICSINKSSQATCRGKSVACLRGVWRIKYKDDGYPVDPRLHSSKPGDHGIEAPLCLSLAQFVARMPHLPLAYACFPFLEIARAFCLSDLRRCAVNISSRLAL